MPGGLMQLNYAPSAQAEFIFGNPQITFWKAAYRRHSNFAMESRSITDMSTTPNFGETVTYTIPRDTSDLLYKMHFETILPDPSSGVYCPYPGEKLLKSVKLQIGGTTVDKHTSDWLHVWNELTLSATHRQTYEKMVGHRKGTVIDGSGGKICVPLQFWFCRHAGLALPRKAIDKSNVQIIIEFERKHKMIRNSNDPAEATAANTLAGYIGSLATTTDTNLYGDVIFLDVDESARFLANRHEYLIEQVQEYSETFSGTSKTIKLNFNHSVKELIWITKNTTLTTDTVYTDSDTTTIMNDHFNYTRGMGYDSSGNVFSQLKMNNSSDTITGNLLLSDDPLTSASIKFNSEARLSDDTRVPFYFNLVQPLNHHSGTPSPGIYVYSFALRPEEFQPTGTVNMSRIDAQQITLNLRGSSQGRVIAFALNYNILIIENGLANLVWST